MFTILILFASLGTLYSAPINPTRVLPQEIHGFVSHTLDAPAGICSDLRSTYGIVWSCLVTILACVWGAVHPNIPGPWDSGWTILKDRIITMYCALLAPELMTYWALRQRFAAQRIANEYNDKIAKAMPLPKKPLRKRIHQWFTHLPKDAARRGDAQPWVITHGFLLQMGGFMLYRDHYPLRVLDFKDMSKLIDAGKIDAPTVTEAEIKDRSKGNALSKAVVMLQTLWFMAQCIARLTQGLPLSELEVVTLGFASLNGIMYGVWWNKPQEMDVAIPMPLKKKDEQRRGSTLSVLEHPDGTMNMVSRTNTTITLESSTTEIATVDEQESIGHLHRLTRTTTTDTEATSEEEHRQLLMEKMQGPSLHEETTKRTITSAVLEIMRLPFRSLYHMMNDDVIPEDATRVPTFYAPEASSQIPGYASLLIGALFGSIHFFAWASVFPSRTEQLVWRFSTLITTAGPLFFFMVVKLGEYLDSILDRKHRLKNMFDYIPRNLLIGVSVAYILARGALLTVALLSLRALPQDVFAQITWTSFIPHL